MKLQKILLISSISIIYFSYWIYQKAQVPNSKLNTIFSAFKTLYNMEEEQVTRFLNSYQVFDEHKLENNTEKFIVDYYNVLNLLCSLGDVEKMYIPPVVDPNQGVFGNQIQYERRIMQYINASPGKRILDMGCGRGGVAFHVCTHSGASVTGINIDPSQIKVAKQRSKNHNLEEKLNFIETSFNNALPFKNESFDGAYNIQAFTYIIDYDFTFKEIFRVLKPGSRISILDWFTYENFDSNNPEHLDLMRKCKGIIGAVLNPTTKQMVDALERAGFKVEVDENASINGHQYTLIESADFYFTTLQALVKFAVKIKLLPNHFLTLLNRLTQDADSFIQGDKQKLWTSCHQLVAVKPLQQYQKA